MAIKTIFLDRDGVINKELNYLYKIEDFKFIKGVFKACKYFQNLNYKIIIITNQSGISRGYYTENDYHALTSWMVAQFKKKQINILDVFHCSHLPESNCNCRKPKPGMFIKAQKKYDIDMDQSWVIGDKESDIAAGIISGIGNTILVKSGHKINEEVSNAKYIIDTIDQSHQIITN